MRSSMRLLPHQASLCFLCGMVAFVAACGSISASDKRKSDTKGDGPAVDSGDATDGDEPVDDDDKDAVIPTTKFLAPTKALDPTVAGSYEFKVEFAEQPPGTTWSLFYTRTADDQSAGTIILADQPLSVVSYTWTMGGLDIGEYFFYLVLNFESGGTSVVSASGSVDYTEAGATGNVSPQITALDPEFAAGTRLVKTTDTVDIAYSVFDADGDDVTVKIELSSDGGVTYDKVLASDAPHDGFAWDVAETSVAEGLYHLRISASDGVSLPDEKTSSAPFVVSGNTNYTYAADIQPILAANCTGCHDAAGAGFAQFQWASYGNGPDGAPDKFAGYMSDRITTLAVDFETMPKDGPPLSSEDRTKIKIWYLQGAAP